MLTGKSRDALSKERRAADPSQWVAREGSSRIPPDTAAIDWSRLSKSDRKPAVFAADTEFRLVLDELTRQGGFYEYAHNHGLIIFKPEAMRYPDRIARAISLCDACGFEALFCRSVPLDALRRSLLWRYQFNRATPSRLRVMLCLETDERCIVLVLRARSQDPIPTSIRLAILKGSGLKAKYNPRTLRGTFEPPNPLINFVHASDEPIDFIREIGVLLSYIQRKQLYQVKEALPLSDVLAIAAQACEMYKDRPVLPDSLTALTALRAAAVTALGEGNSVADYVDRLVLHSEYMDLEHLLSLLQVHSIAVDPDVLLVAACHTMIKTYDGMSELAEKVPIQKWGVKDLPSDYKSSLKGKPPSAQE